MNQVQLHEQLNQVAWRYRQLRLWQLLAGVWLLAALAGLAFWAFKPPQANPLPLLYAATAVWATVAIFLAVRYARSYEWIAQRVESAFPELQTCLLAALEQQPDLANGRFGYLQGRVIHQALDHARAHSWPEVVSKRRMALAATANVLCFTLFLATIVLLPLTAMRPNSASASSSASAARGSLNVTVEPGDTEVERGTSLLVLARVQGLLPAEAMLIHETAGGDETCTPLAVSLNDPVFGGRISVIDQPLQYRVEMGGYVSPTYHVTVFEYPRLERADAHLVYPQYAALEPRVVQDVRTVSVPEGTKLTLRCLLNKAVASVTLVDTAKNAPGEPIVLAPATGERDPAGDSAYETTMLCQQSRRWKLELVDEAGRKNVKPYEFKINVLINQPPNLKPVFPAKDLEVSPLEELDVKASAWDDYGVARFGLTYSFAGGEPVDVVLLEQAAARQRHEAAHVMRLEDLHAEPDQLLAYHWWAEDIGPDGQPRRTFSDMYFAEVRPFEEIFRQGEPPAGGQQQRQQQQQGQGQNAQDAQQLAKLQKDIINATWKLIRRETRAKPTGPFAADAGQVQLSQDQAREQASALAERVQDEQSKEHIDAVLKHMQAASEQFKLASETPAAQPLRPALAAAQAAYQALLKLRAREHEVVRQQQRQQGQQSSSQQSSARSQQQQQQMQQLDLKQEENRYETERTAQERQQESAEDRENRQVQSRLRELARRQGDVNERLKELQSALEEARTEQQKEELRNQLKRLQDEQRQILQDTDELQSRLDQPENAERMAEQRQQLEETRDQVRRASESLEQQKVTQAAASGTRAEQQFEDLREEFRRRASNRFNQEMQEMRQAARTLDEKEQQIAEQIKQPGQPQNGQPQPGQQKDPGQQKEEEKKGEKQQDRKSAARKQQDSRSQEKQPTLREDDNQREKIAEEVARQRTRLGELQEKMKSTLGEAESAEPILSQRLYDAVRNVQDRQVDRALQQTERAVRQGLPQDAQQQEAAAGQGLRELREAVERAADGVLGDQTESLRRAREELRDLSQELTQEIRRNTGEEPPDPENRQPGENQPPPGQQGPPGQPNEPGQPPQPGQPGQPRNGERQPNQRDARSTQPGERQPGERQQGERQPGQPQPGERQPGERQQGQPQPGEGRPGDGPPGERQPGQPQQSQPQPGQGQPSERQPGQRQPGEGQPGQPQPGQRGGQRLGDQIGGMTGGGGNQREWAPLTGEDFRQWSDRLRDVEEMVDDPELRAEAARIRDRARAIRAEHKRHSAEPNWELVQQQVAGPLVELQQRVSEELLRRTSKKALVPLDRDPVPPQYSEKTRRYYERLGSGK